MRNTQHPRQKNRKKEIKKKKNSVFVHVEKGQKENGGKILTMLDKTGLQVKHDDELRKQREHNHHRCVGVSIDVTVILNALCRVGLCSDIRDTVLPGLVVLIIVRVEIFAEGPRGCRHGWQRSTPGR